MTSILVIGRTGQLARSLAERAGAQGISLAFAGRPEVDLAKPESLRSMLGTRRADIIVNAAAFTDVDRAEDEPEAARAANAVAAHVLASAARENESRLIHISTDHVFAGTGDRPWREDDPALPANLYGETKLEGEQAVREALASHVIVRTSWLYSPFGHNFVRTMLDAARARPDLQVVEDQIGNPTCALDLADGLLAIVEAWKRDPGRGLDATYHLAGTGSTNRADFARAIVSLSRARGGPSASVRAISSAEWPVKALRPLNSRLDSGLFAETFGYRAPPWRESLEPIIDRLVRGRAE